MLSYICVLYSINVLRCLTMKQGFNCVLANLRDVYFPHPGLFETLPGRVQCEMLLKATEQCFNTLEKAEMLLLLLKRFPESVVQHGVCKMP